MPLTYLVEHLNQRLKALHPDAVLAGNSRIEYPDRVVTARINGLSVTPVQSPVFDVGNSVPVARGSQLLIRNKAGKPIPHQFLYLQAWDGNDIIFLDRLLRTLHSLHHVNRVVDDLPQDRLILDVHSRHLASVPDGHGLVFEGLLKSLGLSPERIILRLNLPAAADRDGFGRAVGNFRARGYRLLLEPARPESEWLRRAARLGVAYIAVNGSSSRPDDDSGAVVRWNDLARQLGLKTLLTGVDTPAALDAAIRQGFELVEGAAPMVMSGSAPVAVRGVGQLPISDIHLADWML